MAKVDSLKRFTNAAIELGIDVEYVVYPARTHTAADAAEASGCDLSQIVKSLVFTGPEGPLVALTSGKNRVDLDKLANVVGGPVVRCNADAARAATGFSIGATPPFGYPSQLATFLDPDLLDHEIVYAAAGRNDSCFPLSPLALRDLTNTTVFAFTED